MGRATLLNANVLPKMNPFETNVTPTEKTIPKSTKKSGLTLCIEYEQANNTRVEHPRPFCVLYKRGFVK